VQGRCGKNNDMAMIYLSPHLDDVALSLGGLIWEQTQAGLDVSILTVCAGDPPEGEFSSFAESLHTRWEVGQDGMVDRRAEDIVSCQRLGAAYHHLDIPDCIYRRSYQTGKHLYDSEDALWVPVHPDETPLIEIIRNAILDIRSSNDTLICPLTLGDHVDHRLTRAAAESTGVPLQYYADYPYVLKLDVSTMTTNMDASVYSITPDGMSAWQDAVAAHRSQISTFWKNLDDMKSTIQFYYDWMGGIWLWK